MCSENGKLNKNDKGGLMAHWCDVCKDKNYGSVYECDNCGLIGDCCIKEYCCIECGEVIDMMETPAELSDMGFDQ